jgi:hypothetical protein
LLYNMRNVLLATSTLHVLSTLEQKRNVMLKTDNINWQASFNPLYCITKVIYISFVMS